MSKRCILGPWLLLNSNRKPYPRYPLVPFSTPWRDPKWGLGPPKYKNSIRTTVVYDDGYFLFSRWFASARSRGLSVITEFLVLTVVVNFCRSVKRDCPAVIRIGVDDSGENLVVRTVLSDHNHEIIPAAFQHSRQQRRLDTEARQEAAHLLQLDANTYKVCEYPAEKTGKVVTSDDVQNIRTATRERNKTGNPVDKVLQLLRDIPGADVGIGHDNEGNIAWLSFQSQEMKRNFELFGDVLIFDATYKLNNRSMPLYLPLVVDSDGNSRIVAMILSANEEATTVSNFLEKFAASNNCSQVKCLLVDKDLSTIACLKATFTAATVNLCLFHVLKTFRREVTETRLGITVAQKTTILEILQRLAYAATPNQVKLPLLN